MMPKAGFPGFMTSGSNDTVAGLSLDAPVHCPTTIEHDPHHVGRDDALLCHSESPTR